MRGGGFSNFGGGGGGGGGGVVSRVSGPLDYYEGASAAGWARKSLEGERLPFSRDG